MRIVNQALFMGAYTRSVARWTCFIAARQSRYVETGNWTGGARIYGLGPASQFASGKREKTRPRGGARYTCCYTWRRYRCPRNHCGPMWLATPGWRKTPRPTPSAVFSFRWSPVTQGAPLPSPTALGKWMLVFYARAFIRIFIFFFRGRNARQ